MLLECRVDWSCKLAFSVFDLSVDPFEILVICRKLLGKGNTFFLCHFRNRFLCLLVSGCDVLSAALGAKEIIIFEFNTTLAANCHRKKPPHLEKIFYIIA